MMRKRRIRRLAVLPLATLALAGCDTYSMPVSINGQPHTLTVTYTCPFNQAQCLPSANTLTSSNPLYSLDGNADFTFGSRASGIINSIGGSLEAWYIYTGPQSDEPVPPDYTGDKPPVLAFYTDPYGDYTLTPTASDTPPTTASTLSQDTTDLVTTPPVIDTTAGPMAPSN